MRKKSYKGRCEKRAIKKCESICKTYDPIQSAFVTILDNRNDIAEIQCNVELDGDAADFTTDIVAVMTNGELMVRECVSRKILPRTWLTPPASSLPSAEGRVCRPPCNG